MRHDGAVENKAISRYLDRLSAEGRHSPQSLLMHRQALAIFCKLVLGATRNRLDRPRTGR